MESYYETGKILKSLVGEIEQVLVAGEREMIEKYKKATPAEKRKFLMEIRRSEKIKLRRNRKSYRVTRKSIIEARKRLEKDLRGK